VQNEYLCISFYNSANSGRFSFIQVYFWTALSFSFQQYYICPIPRRGSLEIRIFVHFWSHFLSICNFAHISTTSGQYPSIFCILDVLTSLYLSAIHLPDFTRPFSHNPHFCLFVRFFEVFSFLLISQLPESFWTVLNCSFQQCYICPIPPKRSLKICIFVPFWSRFLGIGIFTHISTTSGQYPSI